MSMSAELKKAQCNFNVKKKELHAAQAKLNQEPSQQNLRALKKKRNDYKKSKEKLDKIQQHLVVSEHACLRYIERVFGITREDIEEKILTEEIVSLYTQLGDGVYPLPNNVRARIKDGTVVTIIK